MSRSALQPENTFPPLHFPVRGVLCFLCALVFPPNLNGAPAPAVHRAHYYYYDQRVELAVASQWLSLKISPASAGEAQSASHQPELPGRLRRMLAQNEVTAAGVSWRGCYLVHISSASHASALAAQLSQAPEIELVAPVLLHGRVRQMVTDEFILGLKADLQEAELEALAQRHGALVVERLAGRAYLLRATPGSGRHGLDAANAFCLLPEVAFAQPNFIYPAADLEQAQPNDPGFQQQWALHNSGQPASVGECPDREVRGINGADLDALRAWQITTGDARVKIAMLDSGVDLDHPDLRANLLPGYDVVARDSVPQDDNYSGQGGHGTATAGIVAAVANNGIGISGVAPGCRIIPIRVFNESATDDVALAAGLRAAVALGADVISNSWGGGAPSALVTEAIRYARTRGREGKGCVLVFAAGNYGNGEVVYPACLPEVIAVGASNMFDEKKSAGSRDGQLQWGSNYGEALDLVAPTMVMTTDLTGAAGFAAGDYCPAFAGTSAACPHVAGVAALMLSLAPQLTAEEVEAGLAATCEKIGELAYNTWRAHGAWNAHHGYGRVNAYRALMWVQGVDAIPPQILHTPVPRALPETPMVLTATITDASGVAARPSSGTTGAADPLDSPRMFFRVAAAGDWGSWQSLAAERGETADQFRFTLPAQHAGSRLEYFLAAGDAAAARNSTTFPGCGHELAAAPLVPPGRTLRMTVGEPLPVELHWNTNGPLAIPATAGMVASALEIAENFVVADLEVKVNLRHSYIGDLILVLESPQGTRVTLTSRNGGEAEDYWDTVFDDEAGQALIAGPPYSHRVLRPEEPLARCKGEAAQGRWRLLVLDRADLDGGSLESWGLAFTRVQDGEHTAVQAPAGARPTRFTLLPGYPNPLQRVGGPAKTVPSGFQIRFDLPAEAAGEVQVTFYNALGQVVRHLLAQSLPAGRHNLVWDGRDEYGREASAGMYLYTVRAGAYQACDKLMVLR